MAWTDAARQAAIEARKAKAKATGDRSALAKAHYKPSNAAKQAVARLSEVQVKSALLIRSRQGGHTHPIDATTKRGGKTYAVEVKTLVDNKNDKITMHPESVARKVAWAKKEKATLHTVVVDRRGKTPQMYHREGIGSFRLSSLTPVTTGAQLRRLIYGKGK